MRMDARLDDIADLHGSKTALVCGDRRLSYRELSDLSSRLAGSLLAHNIQPGDRVLVFADNGWEAVVSILASWKAGAVICVVNPSTKPARLAHIAQDCGASVIIAQARLAGVVAQACPDHHGIILSEPHIALPDAIDLAACLQTRPLETSPDQDDTALAALIYTSGSTGEPKGVMLTHRNLDFASGSIAHYLNASQDDVILSVLPLSFGYGLSQLLIALRTGATLVLEKSFAFPFAILQRIRDEQASVFPVVPPMIALLLQIKDLDTTMLSSLRTMSTAAAALPTTHLAKIRELLPDVRLYSMYGQTECIRISYLPPEQLDVRPDSVGIAIPGAVAEVVDETGARVPPGTIGELVVTGPHVMAGYWNAPDATAKALRTDPHTGETRLHTGDLFTQDVDGFLTFVSRSDDIIKSRGEKVPPKEIEAVLHAMDGIVEALVTGVDDPVFGQVIKAFVVSCDPSLTERDVIRHCAKHLQDHMVPKSVIFQTELPKTDSGKLSRRLAAAFPNTRTNP